MPSKGRLATLEPGRQRRKWTISNFGANRFPAVKTPKGESKYFEWGPNCPAAVATHLAQCRRALAWRNVSGLAEEGPKHAHHAYPPTKNMAIPNSHAQCRSARSSTTLRGRVTHAQFSCFRAALSSQPPCCQLSAPNAFTPYRSIRKTAISCYPQGKAPFNQAPNHHGIKGLAALCSHASTGEEGPADPSTPASCCFRSSADQSCNSTQRIEVPKWGLILIQGHPNVFLRGTREKLLSHWHLDPEGLAYRGLWGLCISSLRTMAPHPTRNH